MTPQFVAQLVGRWAVPSFLAIGVVAGFMAAGRVTASVRVNAYAGFWAGILALFGFALLLPVASFPSAPNLGVLGLRVLGLLSGVCIGLIGLSTFWVWRRSRWVGIACFLQSFGAGACLLGHFLDSSWVDVIAGLAIGCALGPCLLFLVPRGLTDWVAAEGEDMRVRRQAIRAQRQRAAAEGRARRRQADSPSVGRRLRSALRRLMSRKPA